MWFLCFVCTGCSYVVNEGVTPDVFLAHSYSRAPQETLESEDGAGKEWWQAFEDPLLDDILEKFLAGNFSLKQTYARLKQAQLFEGQAGTRLLPELNSNFATSSTWISGGEHSQNSLAELELSWEVDVWNRLSSSQKAFSLEAGAAQDIVHDTALLLTAQVADTYFQIVEQHQRLALLDKQIGVNETFLELIELRFANGAASVVDIYQQRQLLASLQTQIPVDRSKLRTLQHRLHVLLGLSPSQPALAVAHDLPTLGPLPRLGLPAHLLVNRPDLRAAQKKLVAADYRVAEAVANRLPQFKLFSRGGIDGSSFSGDNLFLSVLAEAVAPIIDWGRRKKEVERQQAIVEEELARYSEVFLLAIEEVENALWQEQEQVELIASLKKQLSLAQANLKETRNRYMQGLTDYLPVLTALHTLQGLERDLLLSRRQLISFRIHLCQALGGSLDLPPASLAKMDEKHGNPQSAIKGNVAHD
ncbi:MAG: efflux transporter outer membrane subunit [Proteobacteria bacterium]|nr:efflux transporter outer membrane subunit [Pseudomonadota bacterium]